jgi:hypothetical protein
MFGNNAFYNSASPDMFRTSTPLILSGSNAQANKVSIVDSPKYKNSEVLYLMRQNRIANPELKSAKYKLALAFANLYHIPMNKGYIATFLRVEEIWLKSISSKSFSTLA